MAQITLHCALLRSKDKMMHHNVHYELDIISGDRANKQMNFKLSSLETVE
jgi:hypothetical protein